MSKENRVKALNFGWRCYFLEGPELNFTKTNYQTYSAEKYGDVIAKYEIENGEYVITQEVTYQELWKIDPNTREKKSIKKAFSIEKFAQHCEMIRENPLFFATVKEYELTTNRMINHYKKCTGLSEKKVRDVLLPPEDRWLSAKEAVRYGIADKIVSTY